jgi:hypothetical protein
MKSPISFKSSDAADQILPAERPGVCTGIGVSPCLESIRPDGDDTMDNALVVPGSSEHDHISLADLSDLTGPDDQPVTIPEKATHAGPAEQECIRSFIKIVHWLGHSSPPGFFCVMNRIVLGTPADGFEMCLERFCTGRESGKALRAFSPLAEKGGHLRGMALKFCAQTLYLSDSICDRGKINDASIQPGTALPR